MAYTVFESTNMASTKGAERIFDAVADGDIEVGTFGYLNGLTNNESVVYNFVKGTKKDFAVVVADAPAWDEDTCRITNQRKDKFVIPAGTRFRVRVVAENDEFAISAEGFESASQSKLQAKKFVTIHSDGKLKVENSEQANAIMNAEIMRVRVVGGVINTTANKYGYSRNMYEVKIKGLDVHQYGAGHAGV